MSDSFENHPVQQIQDDCDDKHHHSPYQEISIFPVHNQAGHDDILTVSAVRPEGVLTAHPREVGTLFRRPIPDQVIINEPNIYT